MRLAIPLSAIALALSLAGLSATAADSKDAVPAYVTAAINDPARKDDAADAWNRTVAFLAANLKK